jgi:polyphenol oxidase
MIEKSHGDLSLLYFESFLGLPGLAHAVTTRPQNYAPHRGVDCEQAVHWRKRVCEILGVSFESLTSPEQVHGGEVLPIEPGDLGRGRDGRQTALQFVDGLITDMKNVPMIILSADCPLVMVYDPDRPAIGAVHASWRGTVAMAADNLVRLMSRTYGSDPAHMKAAISPSAGSCCYEVGDHVRRVARTRLADADTCLVERDGRVFFDLWTANSNQLVTAGVPRASIEIGGLCSICDQRFWSHRRDGAEAGRFGLFLALK